MPDHAAGVVVGWDGSGGVRATRLPADAVLHPEDALEGEGLIEVSPGIVLHLGRPVGGPSSAATVLDATAAVLGALEVRGPEPDRVRLVLGPVARDHRALDLQLLGVVLDVDGTQRGTACGAAACGHPAAAVALATSTTELEAGWLVFSGPLLPSVRLDPGSHAVAAFGHLGAVGVRRR